MIGAFRGKYAFLSNFYEAPVWYEGFCFRNSEAAFQAAKHPKRMAEFCDLKPAQAKKLSRTMPLRDDWEQVKEQVMYEVCKAKFTQNDDLRKLLLGTGDETLVEVNTWGDTTWGMCNGVGKNLLGKTLMRIRRELASEPPVACPFCRSLARAKELCEPQDSRGIPHRVTYSAALITKNYDKDDYCYDTVSHGHYELKFCPVCGKQLRSDTEEEYAH